MGASREVQFSALAEPALLLGLAALAAHTAQPLADRHAIGGLARADAGRPGRPLLVLVAAALR